VTASRSQGVLKEVDFHGFGGFMACSYECIREYGRPGIDS
jgi:hypothetical protein